MEEKDLNQKKTNAGRTVPVRHAQESLSPFVIRLGELPSPSDLMDAPLPTDAFNFLVMDEDEGDKPVFAPPKADEEASLHLSPQELASQFEEDFQAKAAIEDMAPEASGKINVILDLPDPEENEGSAEAALDESEAVELDAFRFIPIEPITAIQAPKKFRTAFLPHGWQRAIGVFAMLAIALILPLRFLSYVGELREAKAKVASQGNEALSTLSAAAQSVVNQDMAGASQSFHQARERFGAANETIQDLGSGTAFLLSVLPQTKKTYKAGEHLLRAGSSLSKAGLRITEGLSAVSKTANTSLTARISTFSQYVSSALPLLAEAEKEFSRVDGSTVPEEYQGTFQEISARLPSVIKSLKEFIEFGGMALKILGADGEKRYLVVFQNNTELRPTGGFMGSFAEITLRDGAISSMEIPGGGTYDLDGSNRSPLAAPKPLQLLSAKWEFRDANWFPDFPTSSRKIMRMYENAGGSTVDGVIAINATFVTDLLDLLGPISMPNYRRTINAQNFLGEAQKIVELEYDQKENKPKAFIADLAPALLDRTTKKTGEEFFRLLDLANRGLGEREIQIYLADNALESRTQALGWGGEIKQADGDALMVVNANLGGGKTDGVIKETIDMTVVIDESGIVTNTVVIARKHFGIPHALFTGMNNVNYVRLYVPKGSTLISASGFAPPSDLLFKKPNSGWMTDADVAFSEDNISKDPASNTDMYEENGRTVFGNWTQTKPGTTTKTLFSYRLPWKISPFKNASGVTDRIKTALGIPPTGAYTLAIQKQPGAMDRTTIVHLELPNNVTLLWSSENTDNAIFTNASDAFFSALLEYHPPTSL